MESGAGEDLSVYDTQTDDSIKTDRSTAPVGDGTTMEIAAPVRGKAIPLEEVQDEVFSSGMLGKGFAVEPKEGKIFAPADGVIDNITETKHAIGIIADDDANILIHVGLDTVKLGGRGFELKVEEGAKIKKGDLLMTFDLSAIKKSGYRATTPVVVCNSDEFQSVEVTAQGDVNAGDTVMRIVK